MNSQSKRLDFLIYVCIISQELSNEGRFRAPMLTEALRGAGEGAARSTVASGKRQVASWGKSRSLVPVYRIGTRDDRFPTVTNHWPFLSKTFGLPLDRLGPNEACKAQKVQNEAKKSFRISVEVKRLKSERACGTQKMQNEAKKSFGISMGLERLDPSEARKKTKIAKRSQEGL